MHDILYRCGSKRIRTLKGKRSLFRRQIPPPGLPRVLSRLVYSSTTQEPETLMAAPTFQISEASQRVLQELAEKTGEPIVELLDKALAAYRRKVFLEQLDAGYAELRADPNAWAEVETERRLWDATLMDGLDSEER